MQEFDTQIFAHRFYHEAPDDVFELSVRLLSEVDEYGRGRGGLNVTLLVRQRCMRVVESVATRLTHIANEDDEEMEEGQYYLLLVALTRCKGIQHIKCESEYLVSLEGCPNGLKSLIIIDGSSLERLEPLSACHELETLTIRYSYSVHIQSISPGILQADPDIGHVGGVIQGPVPTLSMQETHKTQYWRQLRHQGPVSSLSVP